VGHVPGSTLESVPFSADHNSIIDTLANGFLKTTGAVDTTKIPAVAGGYGITLTGGGTTNVTLPASGILATKAGTETFTNKRITKRILSAATYTTDTGTSLNCDTLDMFIVTAQGGALKFNNPTGTPTDGQTLVIAVSSSTTVARALTYDTQYESSTVTLPSTTTATTVRLTIGLIWRADTSKWTCVAVA
jgi:hypothetical protein